MRTVQMNNAKTQEQSKRKCPICKTLMFVRGSKIQTYSCPTCEWTELKVLN